MPSLQSQNVVALRPLISNQISAFRNEGLGEQGARGEFRQNLLLGTFGFGFLIDVATESGWRYTTGIIKGDVGMYGYKVRVPNEKNSSNAWGDIWRIPLTVSRRLSGQPLKILKLDPYQEKYLMIVEPELMMGMSVDVIDPLSDISDESSLSLSSANLKTRTFNTHRKNPMGMSLSLGIAFQFKQNFKDRLRIEIYYNQGLLPLVESTIEYQIVNQPKRYVVQHSRGSIIAINVSYPIRLFKFSKRHAIQE